MEADRITLTIYGRLDDPLCDQLTNLVIPSEAPE
jgi:hypothetical protein